MIEETRPELTEIFIMRLYWMQIFRPLTMRGLDRTGDKKINPQ